MTGRRAVVWGASGGIGAALIDALVSSGNYTAVYAGSRRAVTTEGDVVRPFAFDLREESSIEAAAKSVIGDGSIDLVLVTTGMLHSARHQPEKQFAAITSEGMLDAFRINALGPALIAKHMIAGLPRERRSVFAALSARVGSIGDNRLGGWHSYRASKAALNMIIANLAIELGRTHPRAIAVGLHPGTVDTPLSRPFHRPVPSSQLFAPEMSASHLLSVVENLSVDVSGSVLAWNGEAIAP